MGCMAWTRPGYGGRTKQPFFGRRRSSCRVRMSHAPPAEISKPWLCSRNKALRSDVIGDPVSDDQALFCVLAVPPRPAVGKSEKKQAESHGEEWPLLRKPHRGRRRSRRDGSFKPPKVTGYTPGSKGCARQLTFHLGFGPQKIGQIVVLLLQPPIPRRLGQLAGWVPFLSAGIPQPEMVQGVFNRFPKLGIFPHPFLGVQV